MITASYTGREAAYVKNELLRAYLEPLFMIIGQQASRISYIDCFSGPWQKGGQNFDDTSVAVSLGIMEKCHNDLFEKFRRNVQFRGLFIERDKEAFGRLESFLKSESPGGVNAHCLKGDFYDLRDEVLSWCGNRDFCFFFVDPTGWRHIAIPTLQPLLGRPSCEFLINFMFDSILRAHAQTSFEEHMKAIFGEAPDTSHIAAEEKERFLFNLYCRQLKACASTLEGKTPRCAHMRVLYPTRDRTVYDLVYLTWDAPGIVAFMEASEQLEMEQRKVRALAKQSKKIRRSRQLEIFSADKFVEEEPGVDPGKVKEYWLTRLSNAPKRFGVAEFADMLEETGWFVNDFQRTFLELEREGKVRNLASTGMRTENAVHYWANGNRGELLEKIEESRPKSR
ncbi:MAG: three-Cys-motif partner protein TcmP [Syntrophobacteraceae bacterium]|jgi:three-Cys-motif partner protein